ncbi:MAG: flagellar hook-basal body complex protein FliE [Pseudomonadota bacterium]
MAEIDVNQVLAQMRTISARARSEAADAPPTSGSVSFDRLLTDSINMVSRAQGEAKDLRTAFQTGATDVPLPEVMVAVQKASISFEAMTQVRNKLLTAYQEIMNMQV